MCFAFEEREQEAQGKANTAPKRRRAPKGWKHLVSGISKHLVNKPFWKISVAFFEEEDI